MIHPRQRIPVILLLLATIFVVALGCKITDLKLDVKEVQTTLPKGR